MLQVCGAHGEAAGRGRTHQQGEQHLSGPPSQSRVHRVRHQYKVSLTEPQGQSDSDYSCILGFYWLKLNIIIKETDSFNNIKRSQPFKCFKQTNSHHPVLMHFNDLCKNMRGKQNEYFDLNWSISEKKLWACLKNHHMVLFSLHDRIAAGRCGSPEAFSQTATWTRLWNMSWTDLYVLCRAMCLSTEAEAVVNHCDM